MPGRAGGLREDGANRAGSDYSNLETHIPSINEKNFSLIRCPRLSGMPATDSGRAVGDARPLRSDARRSRDAILAAVAELLTERGPGFTLTDAARRSGVATATAYRHFPSVDDAVSAYYDQLCAGLLASWGTVPEHLDPASRIRGICHEWAAQAASWGPAAVYLRSPRGFLDRLDSGDPFLNAVHDLLSGVLRAAVEAGVIPAQDLSYATLLWVTLFDERVVLDLTHTRGLSPAAAADWLANALLASLRASAAEEPS
jgi:AcrR family transcriptional regulator